MAVLIGALTLAAIGSGCGKSEVPTAPTAGKPEFTPSSLGTSTLLGRATFGDPNGELFKVKRITGDWQFEVKAKPAFDLAVQDIVFHPGGQSGWHTHPGPVFIQVIKGTMTFYMSDDPNCTPIVRSAGSSPSLLISRSAFGPSCSDAPSCVIAGDCSKTATSKPLRMSAIAVVSPPTPPPTIAILTS